MESKDVIDYFKRVYPLTEINNMYQFVSRHPSFSKELYDRIKAETTIGRDLFFKNIREYTQTSTQSFEPLYTQKEIDEVTFLFMTKVIGLANIVNNYVFKFPSVDEMMYQRKAKASAGLPDPRVKKRDVDAETKTTLSSLVNEELNVNDLKVQLSGIGQRPQVKASGYKARVIFLVENIRQALGNAYRIPFYELLKLNEKCELFVGKTQKQISEFTLLTKNYHTLEIDMKKFDMKITNTDIVLAFTLIERSLRLNGYALAVFRYLRNLVINTGHFHPTVGIVNRKRGLTSGDTFTSILGSIVNFIITYVCLLRYCKLKRIDFYNRVIFCAFLGDDIVIVTDFLIDEEVLFSIYKELADFTCTLEGKSVPGECNVTFLGSTWVSGKPYRSKELMLIQVLFGNGNVPSSMYNNPMLHFVSRGMDIFGNSFECEEMFRGCGIPLRSFKYGTRLFHNYENYTFFDDYKPGMGDSFESRGYYYRVDDFIRIGFNNIWETR
jgi:hypothetical protein